jgi:hypothetical protein
MKDILLTVSDELKVKLDLKRQAEGISIKNYINNVLERELAGPPTARRTGRRATS